MEIITKVVIPSPKKFFNEVTLASTEAKKWLSSRISAAENLAESTQGKDHPRPQIWILTGLILMQHATWTRLSSKNDSFIQGEKAPFDPTGVSAIRRLSVSDDVRPTFGLTPTEDVKHVSGAVIHETGKYPGTRGWAAQWQRIDIKILKEANGKVGVPNQLKLKPSSKIAAVELQENFYADNEDEDDEDQEAFDDEYWEALLDASEELM